MTIQKRIVLTKGYLKTKYKFTQLQLDVLFEGPSDLHVITAQAGQYGYHSREKLLRKGGVEKIEGGDGMYYRQHGLFAEVMSRNTVKISEKEYEIPILSERLLPHQFDVDNLLDNLEYIIRGVVKKYGLSVDEKPLRKISGLKEDIVDYLVFLGNLDDPENYRQQCEVQLKKIGKKLQSIFSKEDKAVISNFETVINGHDLVQSAMRRYAGSELREMLNAMRFYHYCMSSTSETGDTIDPDQSILESAFHQGRGIFERLIIKNRSSLLFV